MAEKLTRDLDIIQNSEIEITVDPMTSDLNIIQKLDDEPNDVGGLSAAELKAKFDEAGNIIKTYINETLVPEVLSEGITEAQRAENEAARQAAETVRNARENERAMHEAARQGDETRRISKENEREAAEQERSNAESERRRYESVRSAAEAERRSAETGRASAEMLRQEKETAREAAESARESAETQRQADQAAFFQGVSAQAVTLEPGAEATAQATPEGGSFKLTIGVPQGIQGPQGEPGDSIVPNPISVGYARLLGLYESSLTPRWFVIPMGGDSDTAKPRWYLGSTNATTPVTEGAFGFIAPISGTSDQVFTRTKDGAKWKDVPNIAYQIAVEYGYTGTEAEFGELMADAASKTYVDNAITGAMEESY